MRDIKQAFWIAGQNFYGWKKKSEDLDDLYFGSYIMSDAVGSDYFPCDKI